MIPLLALGVAIAVVPVLYGTIRDPRWEEAHKPQPLGAAAVTETAAAPGDTEPAVTGSSRLEFAHREVEDLTARLDQLRNFLAQEEAIVRGHHLATESAIRTAS